MAHFPVARNGGCECGCQGGPGLSPCGECGSLCYITFDVTVPPGTSWEAYGNSIGGLPPCDCELSGDYMNGTGPMSGIMFTVDWPWWSSICTDNPAGCCVDLYVDGWLAPEYLHVTTRDCMPYAGGFIEESISHTACDEVGWSVALTPDGWGCYHCEYDTIWYDHHAGDENYSDCIPDFTIHSAWSESYSCQIDGCTFNFTNGSKVVFVYDRYIDPCACTQETTGWVYGLTVDIPFCPITYDVAGLIDGSPLDGHIITAWGSFALTFGIVGTAGQNAYLGRYHVRIFGIACDDGETQVADYPAGSWVVVQTDNCWPLEHTDEITVGGRYGPWTPDPLAEYKAYRVQVDLEPWDQVRYSWAGIDPETTPVHPNSPMATQSFTVHIDTGLFACP